MTLNEITELGLSSRLTGLLQRNRITTIQAMETVPTRELASIHGMTPEYFRALMNAYVDWTLKEIGNEASDRTAICGNGTGYSCSVQSQEGAGDEPPF